MRALILMLTLFKTSDETQSTVSEIAAKGGFGIMAVVGGVGASLAEIEAWMRLGSLAIGMAVGLASLVSIIKSIRRAK